MGTQATLYLGKNYSLAVQDELQLDDTGTSFSALCLVNSSFTTVDLPYFCTEDQSTFTINCSTDLISDIDTYTFTLTRTHDIAQQQVDTITLSVEADCSKNDSLTWLTPEAPSAPFIANDVSYWTADRECGLDSSGASWTQFCGYSGVRFQDYPDFMIYKDDTNGIEMTPYLVSHVGTFSVTVIKTNILNPPEENRTYSSEKYPNAQHYSTLDWAVEEDAGTWAARDVDGSAYLIIDAGQQVDVKGLVVQSGPTEPNEYVTSVKVKYKINSSDSWSNVQSETTFDTGITDDSPLTDFMINFASVVNGQYFKILLKESQVRQRLAVGLLTHSIPDLSTSLAFEITTDCTKYVFDEQVEFEFSGALNAILEIELNLQLELDEEEASWSEHCGYGIYSMTGNPDFCYLDSANAANYNKIICEAIYNSHLDNQPYTINVTRLFDSTGLVDTEFSIVVNLAADCTTVSWIVPVDPADIYIDFFADQADNPRTDTFYVPLDLSWTPDRKPIYDAEGINFEQYCGISDVEYPNLQNWISIGNDFELTISPYLIDHMGENTLSTVKIDPRGEITDLQHDITFYVDVLCELMPYKYVEPNHFLYINIEYTYAIPMEHQEDSSGGSWSPYCGVSEIKSPTKPNWCSLTEFDPEDLEADWSLEFYTILTCTPVLYENVGLNDFDVIQLGAEDTGLSTHISYATTLTVMNFYVMVDCSAISWAIPVSPEFEILQTGFTAQFFPNRHTASDYKGENWDEFCGISNVVYSNLPSFVDIEPGGFYTLNFQPSNPLHAGIYTFGMTKVDSNNLIEDLYTELSFEIIYIDPDIDYSITTGVAPEWQLDSTDFYLDTSDESSLLWRIFPLNFVEDVDVDETLTLSVALGSANAVFSFDQNANEIFVKQTSLLPFKKAAQVLQSTVAQGSPVTVELTVTDSFELESKVNLNFYFYEDQEEEVWDSGITEELQQDEQRQSNFGVEIIPKAKISAINSRGKIQIQFNIEMNFPDDFAEKIMEQKQQNQEAKSNSSRKLQVESQILTVEVITGSGQSEDNVAFDWDVKMIDKSLLEIQMYFENAIAVSSEIEADQVKIKFNHPSYFLSSDGKGVLEVKNIRNAIPSQMPYESQACDAIEATAQSIQKGAVTSGAVTAVTSFALGASLSLLFSLINMVQMYVHYPLFSVVFPGNIFMILQVFIGIAQLDLFTDDSLWEDTFSYVPIHGMDEFNERFSLLSYETQSMVYNLGDLSILQFWIFVKIIMLATFYTLFYFDCFDCQTKRKEKFYRKFKEQYISLFYNWPMRFLFEAYLEFSFSAFIKFQGGSYSTDSLADSFDTFLGLFYLMIVVIGPFYFFIFFGCNTKRIREDKDFQAKFFTVFESSKTNNLGNILYHGIFMFRRLTFVFICIYTAGYFQVFQIQYAVIEATLYFVYLIIYRPLKDPKDNNLEVFTQLCQLVFIYTILAFTDFLQSPSVKFRIGFLSTGIFFLNITVNLLAVFRGQILDFKLKWPKNKQKIVRWCVKKGWMKEDPSKKYLTENNLQNSVVEVKFFSGQKSRQIKGIISRREDGTFAIEQMDERNNSSENQCSEESKEIPINPLADHTDTFQIEANWDQNDLQVEYHDPKLEAQNILTERNQSELPLNYDNNLKFDDEKQLFFAENNLEVIPEESETKSYSDFVKQFDKCEPSLLKEPKTHIVHSKEVALAMKNVILTQMYEARDKKYQPEQLVSERRTEDFKTSQDGDLEAILKQKIAINERKMRKQLQQNQRLNQDLEMNSEQHFEEPFVQKASESGEGTYQYSDVLAQMIQELSDKRLERNHEQTHNLINSLSRPAEPKEEKKKVKKLVPKKNKDQKQNKDKSLEKFKGFSFQKKEKTDKKMLDKIDQKFQEEIDKYLPENKQKSHVVASKKKKKSRAQPDQSQKQVITRQFNDNVAMIPNIVMREQGFKN